MLDYLFFNCWFNFFIGDIFSVLDRHENGVNSDGNNSIFSFFIFYSYLGFVIGLDPRDNFFFHAFS